MPHADENGFLGNTKSEINPDVAVMASQKQTQRCRKSALWVLAASEKQVGKCHTPRSCSANLRLQANRCDKSCVELIPTRQENNRLLPGNRFYPACLLARILFGLTIAILQRLQGNIGRPAAECYFPAQPSCRSAQRTSPPVQCPAKLYSPCQVLVPKTRALDEDIRQTDTPF